VIQHPLGHVSHPRYVAVLAHYQPLDCHPGTSLPETVAEEMVQRMVAERISRKLIRMLPPDSVFPVANLCPQTRRYIPEKLPPREVNGTYFQPPRSNTWRLAHRTVTFLPKAETCPASSTGQ
jgi:hypothetical protein